MDSTDELDDQSDVISDLDEALDYAPVFAVPLLSLGYIREAPRR